MVAVSSPDWLPAGWSVQFRSQRRGCPTAIYIDMETGKKFFSKDDVIRYTKKTTDCHEEPKSTNTKSPSNKSHMQVAAKTDEYPEWLPDGWKVELRTRKSGVHVGKEYKCYIDPSRECTFYSKPEVFRHLKTVKHKSCKSRSRKKTCIDSEAGKKFFSKDDAIHNTKRTGNFHEEPKSTNTKNPSHKSHMQVAAKTDEYPEWLPDGWKVELRTRKSGLQAGTEYKCYIDPLRECTFYSKPEVIRHLKTVNGKSCQSRSQKLVNSKRCIINKKTVAAMNFQTKVVGENNTVEDLPPGWTLEIKLRKVANRIKRDPYYMEPVHGYIFRSKKDVFRYIQTGETRTHVIKPKGMSTNDLKMADDKIQSAATKKLKPPVTRQQLSEAKKSFKSSGECVDTKGECSPNCLSHPKAEPSSIHVGKRSSERLALLSGRPEAKRSKVVEECAETEGERLPCWSSYPKVEPSSKHVGRRSSPRLAVLSNKLQDKRVNVASAPIAEAVSQNHLSEILVVNCAKTEDCSTSKVVLPKAEIYKKFEDKAALVAGSLTDSGKGIFSDAPALASINTSNKSSRMSRMENRKSKRIQIDAEISKKKEKLELPRRSSKRLTGVEPEPVNNPVSPVKAASGTQVLLDTSTEMNSTEHGKSSNKGMAFLSDNAIPEEQHHRLEDEKMLAEKPGPDLCLLFGSDPCLEFAFKTLTGELPIADGVDKEPLQKPTADTVQKEISPQNGTCVRKSRASTDKITKAKGVNFLVPRRTSKRLGRVEPELLAKAMSSERAHQNERLGRAEPELLAKPILSERAHQNETVYSCRSQPLHAVDSSHETPQPSEADQGNKLAHDSCTSVSPSTDQESVKKIEKYDKDQSVPQEQHLLLETEKTPIENSSSQFTFPFLDTWSDPCLDFAFKTLTGEIPVDDNLFPGCFKDTLVTSNDQRDSKAVEDSGSHNFFQSEISALLGAPEQSTSGRLFPMSSQPDLNVSVPDCDGLGFGQQLSMSSSFLPAENVRISGGSGVGSSQHLSVNSSISPSGNVGLQN